MLGSTNSIQRYPLKVLQVSEKTAANDGSNNFTDIFTIMTLKYWHWKLNVCIHAETCTSSVRSNNGIGNNRGKIMWLSINRLWPNFTERTRLAYGFAFNGKINWFFLGYWRAVIEGIMHQLHYTLSLRSTFYITINPIHWCVGVCMCAHCAVVSSSMEIG